MVMVVLTAEAVTVTVVYCYKTVHESLYIMGMANKHLDLIRNTVLSHDHNLFHTHSDTLSVHLLLYDRFVIHIFG